MDDIMILNNLKVSYDKKKVLKDFSLAIPRHRITAVVGPSGCGKSTLLKAMSGLILNEPDAQMSGSILLNGRETTTLPRTQWNKQVGLVFQTPSPFPFSIYKNMAYAPKYYGVHNKKALDALVTEKLQLAGLYEEIKNDLNKSALKLSGGQQQRLCIARALTADPEILLLDEPCSALDVKAIDIIEKMLISLKNRYTIVIVTHNLAQARRISDYMAFLFEGNLVEFGESHKLFSQPDDERTKAFLSGIFG